VVLSKRLTTTTTTTTTTASSSLKTSVRTYAADPHGPPKVPYPWNDPMNPGNWKEEHVRDRARVCVCVCVCVCVTTPDDGDDDDDARDGDETRMVKTDRWWVIVLCLLAADRLCLPF
jgi:hypothetical protein